MDLSVILVGWNTRALTLRSTRMARAALDSLSRSRGLDAELLVVDNGSTDGSAEALESEPGVVRIALPENRGFAGGANAGLARADGDLLLLLNSDAFLEAAALDVALRALEPLPEVGIAGVQLCHEDGRLQNSIHAFPGLVTEITPGWLREWIAPARHPGKRRPPVEIIDIEAPLGAVLFVRRNVLSEVGPLDDAYFFFLEETDWCWRARAAGFRVVHLPQVRVTHLSGASSKRRDPVATRIEYHRSLYRFLRLHRGAWERNSAIAVRQLRSVVSWLLLSIAWPFSARARRRWRERGLLLRWHLRGCPERGGLRGRVALPEERPQAPEALPEAPTR